MVDYKAKKREDDDDELVSALLRIPAKNLEERIRLIEGEIGERKKLSNDGLVQLGTEQLQIDEKIKQVRYTTNWGDTFSKNLKFQFINLEIQKMKEMIGCFKDVSWLKQRLQEAKEELGMEKQKSKLLK